MLRYLNHRHGPLLDALQYDHVSPAQGAQNWTQHARYDLTSAEQRGRITFLDLLAMLCLW